MTVTSPRYALPNKHHDIVEDINNLRTTLETVDSDIHSVEEAIPTLSDRVPEVQSTVLCIESSLSNSEIQNIEPNRYLVVNRNGDGFECVESGGEPGGKTGECCIKRSDKNVDMAWGNILDVSKNGMTAQENAETSQKNETHIFVDEAEIENDEQLPKVELTNYQVKSDLELESNSAVIVCDTAEKIEEKSIEIATNQNFGLVKVGNGFTNNAGTISVPVISNATENSVGIIKTSNGLNNENGVISRADLDPATFADYGVIKLGNGLSINENEEMETSDMSGATIYDLGRVKICNNGIIELEESTLRYRLFVTEDLLVQITSNFYVRDDYSFVLEIVSDGSHIVAFNENLNPNMTALPVNRGTTKITFAKKVGVSAYDIEISRLDAPNPVLLTPTIDSCITSEFSITAPKGSSKVPNYLLDTGHATWSYTAVPELNFKFETLVCVDYVNYLSDSSSAAMDSFIFSGSNDGQNWTTLIRKSNEVVYGKVYTEIKGCFRYFNMKIGYNAGGNQPSIVTLWGTQIDNNESELIPITPYMDSNQTTFATMTGNNITGGSASDLTDYDFNTCVILAKESDNWIKYELSEARVANILELNYRDSDYYSFLAGCQPNWFKLEGSNDDTTWSLLLERQYQGAELQKQNNVLFYEFENQTAYKYYKFTCIATNSSEAKWNLMGLKLYQRTVGKHNFHNLVPTLTSASQDGYEVTASSQYHEAYAPVYAFDGNGNTLWASSSTGTEWLQIKLPSPTISNVIKIASRSDGSINQTPRDFEIQGSNDTETWTTLTSQTNISWTSAGQSQSFSFENETAYQYYRLVITANNGGGTHSLGEFVVGRNVYEYKRYLNKYEYLVPNLTSNNDQGYKVSASSVFEGTRHPAYRVFDGLTGENNKWLSASNAVNGAWLKIELPEAVVADSFMLQSPNEGWRERAIRTFKIQGSNDDSNWTDLLSESGLSWSSNQARTWNTENTMAFKFYRILIEANNGGNIVDIGEFALIRRRIIQEY